MVKINVRWHFISTIKDILVTYKSKELIMFSADHVFCLEKHVRNHITDWG